MIVYADRCSQVDQSQPWIERAGVGIFCLSFMNALIHKEQTTLYTYNIESIGLHTSTPIIAFYDIERTKRQEFTNLPNDIDVFSREK